MAGDLKYFTKIISFLQVQARPHCEGFGKVLIFCYSMKMYTKVASGSAHWSISVKRWQKLFQVKMAPNFTKFEWYLQWKASQGLKNWLKAIKAIKATVQARYEKKLNFHNFFTWLWLFGPKNSCSALGLTKKVHKGQKGHYKARS